MDNMEPLKFLERWNKVLKVVFQECGVIKKSEKQEARNYCSGLKFNDFTK